jgi:hypothetical protein
VVLALLALLAVAGSCWVVLADVAAYDRPPAPPAPEPAREPVSEPVREPVREPAPEPEPVRDLPTAPVHVPVPVPLAAEGSMLAALGTVEHDDHSPLRRVGAAVVLLALTLLAAGAVGFGIYRGVSGLK